MSDADPLSLEFARKHPDAFAKVLSRGGISDIEEVLGQLPPAIAASAAARLSVRTLNALLAGGAGHPDEWLPAASFDDAVALLGRLPRERCLALVNGLQNKTLQRKLLQFLNYPAHSIGALVSDTLLRIPADMPIVDVLVELRALDEPQAPPVVVLDGHERYLGVLSLWHLFVRDPPAGHARDYVVAATPLRPETPLSSAVIAGPWESRDWLPVVDHERRVLGCVYRQRMIDTFASKTEAAPVLQETVSDLVTQLLRVLSELLAGVLAPRRTS